MNWGDAVCAQVDGDLWFPESGGGSTARAALLCRECPVAGECVAEAFQREAGCAAESRWGVWGGMTPTERWVFDLSEPAAVRERRVADWLARSRRRPTAGLRARVASLVAEGVSAGDVVEETGASPQLVWSVARRMVGVAS